MSESLIRQQLVNMLTVGQAHMTFEDAIKNFPAAHFNTRPQGIDYTFWHLLEHLRICQWDILDYCVNANYKHIEWPRDYWPAKDAVTDAAGWGRTVDQFIADRDALVALVQNPQTDLYSPIPHGYDGHTILREILVVADHNAYHIGEFGILRQIVGIW
ncbi:MAG: DinB family protein [Anaerolineae bacterium]|nr:DinB family protein [Anaerolineae bacterium]